MDINKIIEQLEQLPKAEPKPFLATRVKAKAMQQVAEKRSTPFWIPWAATAIFIFTMYTWWNHQDATTANDNEDAIANVEDNLFYNPFSLQDK